MNQEHFPPFSPPGMKFQPSSELITGPAFSKSFKALACILVFGCALWLWRLYSLGLLTLGASPDGWLFVGGGLSLMAYTLVHILRSQTNLNAASIEQTWIWQKKIEIRELAYARLIRVRGLEWIIAPRFYTRSIGGKLAVFYASSPALWADMERLAQELEKFRLPQ